MQGTNGTLGEPIAADTGTEVLTAAKSPCPNNNVEITDPFAELFNYPPLPKTVILNRSPEFGYGFTLRHFIVYPPDETEVDRSDEEQSLFNNRFEPLDTIFVKQVREGSPAHLAGLNTGDRVLRVNDCDVEEISYQELITIIQHSYPELQLIVVPKENDVLQQVFGSAAHNPESNLNLSSTWSSVSSLSSPSQLNTFFSSLPDTSMPGFPAHRKVQGNYPYAKKHHTAPLPTASVSSQSQKTSPRDPKVVDRKQAVYNIKSHLPAPLQRSTSEQNASIYSNDVSKNDFCFGRNNKVAPTRDGSSKRRGVYEPVVVRGEVLGEPKRLEKDPDGRLYEVVQTRLMNTSSEDKGFSPLSKSNTDSSLSRRKDSANVSSPLYATPPKTLKLDQDQMNTSNKENLDRSTQEAYERIKRNVECKEEFLKRPNEPVHRDYHFSPQKMQRPLWPPPASTEAPPGSITKALSYMFAAENRLNNPPLTRTVSQMEAPRTASITMSKAGTEARHFFENRSNSLPNSPAPHDPPSATQASSLPYYSNSLVGNNVAKPYGSHLKEESSSSPSKGGRPFVRTLSRIHENIPSSASPSGSQSSLSSSGVPVRSVPMSWVSDNERIKQLQIVSTRAKKFESPGSDRDSKRTAFHRFELSRLSQRSSACNVADRKREFERRDSDTQINSPGSRFELGTSFNYNPRSKRDHESPWRSSENSRRGGGGGIMKSLSDGGNIFPVSRDLLSPEEPYYATPPLSVDFALLQSTGNRMIPVGGRKIHCEPPDSKDPYGIRPLNDSEVFKLERDRSNSTTHPVHWSPYVNESERRKSSPIIRQHSFHTIQSHLALAEVPESDLAAVSLNGGVSSPHPSTLSERGVGLAPRKGCTATLPSRPERPTFLNIKQHARPHQRLNHQGAVSSLQQRIAASNEVLGQGNAEQPSSPSNSSAAVTRRNKHLYGEDPDHLVRRESYLKATSGDRICSESEVDSDDDRLLPPVSPRTAARRALGSQVTTDLPSPGSYQSSVSSCGILHVKLAKVQGKRASDRSWKTVWAVLRGKALLLYKDGQQANQTPLSPEDQVTLRGSSVGVATDYTKRRHVFRLSTPGGSQFLLQAESDPAMTAWLTSLTAATSQDVDDQSSGKPVNAPLADAETLSPCLDGGSSATTPTSSSLNDVCQGASTEPNVSPQTALKNAKKITSPQRSKLPLAMEQAAKSKKSSGESNSSPKSKTWKGKLGRHLRRMQGGPTVAPPSECLPEGASIGVCLEHCPPSPDNKFVPLLVSLCVGVVESKGLSTQGIYRVPGNRAAVTYLTDVVNKGPHAVDLTDTRWSDVNVISSLLKLFLRKLPDPLISSDLYPMFIEAAKTEDATQRLVELKSLVLVLPDYHYDTLRFLCLHLRHVISRSEDNKMDVRNLAIVFGPTLVRAHDDNMARMVTDMAHQCQIVEALLTHTHWFFSDDDLDDPPPPLPPHAHLPIDTATQDAMEASSQSLLLNNVQKLEANNKETKKLLVSSIISAANRRVQKVRRKVEEEAPPEDQMLSAPPEFSPKVSSSLSHRDARLFPDISDLHESSKLAPQLNSFQPPTPDRTPNDLRYGGSVVPPTQTSWRTEPPGDEVAIKSYRGLRASNQERVRKFEMETRAMLRRDATRRKRELDKQKLEEELQRAKKDLETEDLLDRLADNPSEVMHIVWAPNREALQPCGRGLSLANASLSTNQKDEKLHTEDQSMNPQRPHNEGSDLMSAITATFEEKMRLLQESSAPPSGPPQPTPRFKTPKRPEGNKCKLYRDPSLHRRRTNLHSSAPIKHSASSDAISQMTFEDDCSEKENKEKCEKRSRESTTRVEQSEEEEQRSKELRRSSPEGAAQDPPKRDALRQCDNKDPPRGGRKARIKRRHTVGGMKDMARVAWLKVIEAAHYDKANTAPQGGALHQQQLPTWEQLQLFVEALAEGRRLEGSPKERLDLPKEALRRRLSVRALHPVLESNV